MWHVRTCTAATTLFCDGVGLMKLLEFRWKEKTHNVYTGTNSRGERHDVQWCPLQLNTGLKRKGLTLCPPSLFVSNWLWKKSTRDCKRTNEDNTRGVYSDRKSVTVDCTALREGTLTGTKRFPARLSAVMYTRRAHVFGMKNYTLVL